MIEQPLLYGSLITGGVVLTLFLNRLHMMFLLEKVGVCLGVKGPVHDNCALLLFLLMQTTLSHHCPIVQQTLDKVQLHNCSPHYHYQLETSQTQQTAIVCILIVQKPPFVLVCMLPDLLPALYLLLDGSQLFKRELEVMILCQTLLRDDFMGLFKVYYYEDAVRDVTGELEILEISVKIDAEDLRHIHVSQRIVVTVSLFAYRNIHEFTLFCIVKQLNFSIVIHLEDEDIDAEHLCFGRIPPENVLYLWVKDELE